MTKYGDGFKGLIIVFIMIVSAGLFLNADTIQAASEEMDENLNLEAIATVFAEAKDLEDFEMKLNDPQLQLSNIDLNEDNQVDYLRVVETTEGTLHVIVIQAVVGEDLYQDVATIEVDKPKNQKETIQIVGDPYIYGENYIIEPVYTTVPPIFRIFWMTVTIYHAYHSHYHWGYYPPHFHPWHPRPPYFYRKHIHKHINNHYLYKRTTQRRNPLAKTIHDKVRRNDFAIKHPEKSYINKAVTKPAANAPTTKPAAKPSTKPEVKPATKPSGSPASKPSVKPTPSTPPAISQKPATKPATKPAAKPATKPATKPASKPKPSTRPSVSQKPAFKPKPSISQKPAAKPTLKAKLPTVSTASAKKTADTKIKSLSGQK